MSYLVQEIAAEVIRSTSRDKPADAALREVLKQTRNLAPFDATEVSKTVFLYYRWHGWLREERGGVEGEDAAGATAGRAVSGESGFRADGGVARQGRAGVDRGANGSER